MNQTEALNLAQTRRYLQLIETSTNPDDFREILHPDIRQQEFPNRLVAQGAIRNLDDMLDGVRRGAAVVKSQTYTINNILASGDQVAVEVVWEGTLAVNIGTLKAGDVMKAYFGLFLEFAEGMVIGQRNYDCFEPF